MTAKRGTCVQCGAPDKSLPAHDLCGKCYDALYPPHTRDKRPRKSQEQLFPQRKVITIWETSDGREFGTELEAYKWQLDITNNKLMRAKKA